MEYKQARQATLICLSSNILIAVIKLVVGFMSSATSLVADGFHSLADVLSDALVLLALRFGAASADEEHPYGHGRIETIATSILAVIVFGTGIGILSLSVRKGLHYMPSELGNLPILVAFLSVCFAEGLYRYLIRVARQLNSNLLRANAWHYRSDAAASLVVVAGLLAKHFGFVYGDIMAAFLVAILICRMGLSMAAHSVRELIDTGVDHATLALLYNTIAETPGVCGVHQLRTRSMNGQIFIDVHILVDSKLSVSEGHYIGERVEQSLLSQYESVVDVTVHIDPEDDEAGNHNMNLPDRRKILDYLKINCHQGISQPLLGLTLHYLRGQLTVDLEIPLRNFENREAAEVAAEHCRACILHLQEVREVNLLFKA